MFYRVFRKHQPDPRIREDDSDPLVALNYDEVFFALMTSPLAR
jgi:hypothetical protein